MYFTSKMIVVGLVLILPIALMTPSLIAYSETAQAPNATTPMKNATSPNKPTTKMVVNMSDHTIKVINMTNNQTISVKNFTMENGNNTANLINNTLKGNETQTAIMT